MLTEKDSIALSCKLWWTVIINITMDYNYKLFRDVVIGWSGSLHDARVLCNSPIFKKGNNNELFPGIPSKNICGQEINPVVIGDAAYLLLHAVVD